MEIKQITCGVYRRTFTTPIQVVEKDVLRGTSKTITYTGYQNVGAMPKVVFDALHRNHETPHNTNVMVFREDGNHETMSFTRMKALLNL